MIAFRQVAEYQTIQDVEVYYSVVCPQILALLKVNPSSSSADAKQFGLMSVACVRAVMERSPVHGRLAVIGCFILASLG